MEAKEMVALADTIKVLNDDDALELFKKTLPSASSSSFVQVQVSQSSVKKQALALLKGRKGQKADPRMDLIELAMHGGKMGFEKMLKSPLQPLPARSRPSLPESKTWTSQWPKQPSPVKKSMMTMLRPLPPTMLPRTCSSSRKIVSTNFTTPSYTKHHQSASCPKRSRLL